jgi:hypothetical protein
MLMIDVVSDALGREFTCIQEQVQEGVDHEFQLLFEEHGRAKSRKLKRESFEKLLKVDGVSIDLLLGLATYVRHSHQTELAKLLGEQLLARTDLTNQHLQLIIHNLAPVRQQAADMLAQRPNLSSDDRVYLNPDIWAEIDKLPKKNIHKL